jgi:hypothetical protein
VLSRFELVLGTYIRRATAMDEHFDNGPFVVEWGVDVPYPWGDIKEFDDYPDALKFAEARASESTFGYVFIFDANGNEIRRVQ